MKFDQRGVKSLCCTMQRGVKSICCILQQRVKSRRRAARSQVNDFTEIFPQHFAAGICDSLLHLEVGSQILPLQDAAGSQILSLHYAAGSQILLPHDAARRQILQSHDAAGSRFGSEESSPKALEGSIGP